jgi:hypothetical protein
MLKQLRDRTSPRASEAADLSGVWETKQRGGRRGESKRHPDVQPAIWSLATRSLAVCELQLMCEAGDLAAKNLQHEDAATCDWLPWSAALVKPTFGKARVHIPHRQKYKHGLQPCESYLAFWWPSTLHLKCRSSRLRPFLNSKNFCRGCLTKNTKGLTQLFNLHNRGFQT